MTRRPSREKLARDAGAIFRLLRAFRSIKDRSVRLRAIEAVEAMADRRTAPAEAGNAYIEKKLAE